MHRGVHGPIEDETRDLFDRFAPRHEHHRAQRLDVREPPRLTRCGELRETHVAEALEHRRVDVGDEQVPSAHRRRVLDRELRATEVQQHVADEHEIELADLVGIEVVHAALEPFDLRSQDVVREPETLTGRPVETELARVRNHAPRNVDVAPRCNVGRHHFGAAPLELERPEPVEGRDVEDAHALHRLGQPVVRELRAMVDETGYDHAVTEIDGVVPVVVADAFEDRAALGVERRRIRERQLWLRHDVAAVAAVVGGPRAPAQPFHRGPEGAPVDRVAAHALGELGRHRDRHLQRADVHAPFLAQGVGHDCSFVAATRASFSWASVAAR